MAVKDQLQTPERSHVLCREWVSQTFSNFVLKKNGKSRMECSKKRITTFTEFQASLSEEYHNDSIRRKELLSVVRNVHVCRLAYHISADTFQGVISDLYSSLASMLKIVSCMTRLSEDIDFQNIQYVERRNINAWRSHLSHSKSDSSHRKHFLFAKKRISGL